jgi:hypothetical protein
LEDVAGEVGDGEAEVGGDGDAEVGGGEAGAGSGVTVVLAVREAGRTAQEASSAGWPLG